MTDSIKESVKEVERRRKYQEEYNKKNGIIPKNTINSEIDSLNGIIEQEDTKQEFNSIEEINSRIKKLEVRMKEFSKDLDFENAIKVRDEIKYLKNVLMELM